MFELLIAAGGVWIAFVLYRHNNPPLTAKQKQLSALKEEYDRVRALQTEKLSKNAFHDVGINVIAERYKEADVASIIVTGIEILAEELDTFCAFYPDMDLTEIAGVTKFLHDRERFIKRGYIENWKSETAYLFKTLLDSIPTVHSNAIFSSYVVDSSNVVDQLQFIYSHVTSNQHLYPQLFHVIQSNRKKAGDVYPKEAERMYSNRDLVEVFVGNILFFFELFYQNVGFDIPDKYRREHTHIVGSSGWGKTQLLQNMIANEKGGFCVIDSQGDMIDKIASRFDSIVLDVKDIQYPIAINLFDIDMTGTEVEREQLLNNTLDLFKYIFGALLGAELTQKQGAVFAYITKLMLQIPDATILTLYEIMGHTGEGKKMVLNVERYREYIDQLDEVSQQWFNDRFCSSNFNATREQIQNRLDGIKYNDTLRRIFSAPKNKIDFLDIIQSGKILLIKTDKAFLSGKFSSLFGKFMIAMILQAVYRRAKIPESQRTPWYLYIDEAWEYFDDNIDSFVTQARKYNVPLVFAHHFLSQMTAKLESSVHTNTAIKITGGLNQNDVRTFAGTMRCSKDELESGKKTNTHSEWMCYVRNYDRKLVACSYGVLEAMEELPEEKQKEIKERNRRLYCRPANEITDPQLPKSSNANVKSTQKGRIVDAEDKEISEEKGESISKQDKKGESKQQVIDYKSWE